MSSNRTKQRWVATVTIFLLFLVASAGMYPVALAPDVHAWLSYSLFGKNGDLAVLLLLCVICLAGVQLYQGHSFVSWHEKKIHWRTSILLVARSVVLFVLVGLLDQLLIYTLEDEPLKRIYPSVMFGSFFALIVLFNVLANRKSASSPKLFVQQTGITFVFVLVLSGLMVLGNFIFYFLFIRWAGFGFPEFLLFSEIADYF